MRRTVLCAILIVLLPLTAGQSGSSSSATVAAGPNGTAYKATVEMGSRISGSQETAIDNITFSSSANGRWSVRFDGIYRLPTPCHTLDHDVTAADNNTYTLNIHAVPGDGFCTQVITPVQYTASFEADDRFTLHVQHDGESVKSLQPPRDDTHEPVQQSGVWSRFIGWLSAFLL